MLIPKADDKMHSAAVVWENCKGLSNIGENQRVDPVPGNVQHEKQHRQLQTQVYKAASLGDENTQERPDRGDQEDQDCRQFQDGDQAVWHRGIHADVHAVGYCVSQLLIAGQCCCVCPGRLQRPLRGQRMFVERSSKWPR